MAHEDYKDNESTETPASGHPYEVKKRSDGRWIVVYGKKFPQAGKVWKGTSDYATREEAVAAVRGQGPKSSQFDRFMLDQEPEPVEWSEGEPESDEEDGMAGEGMLSMPKMGGGHGMPITIVLILNSDGMLKRGD